MYAYMHICMHVLCVCVHIYIYIYISVLCSLNNITFDVDTAA